jgi:hypothetical protein
MRTVHSVSILWLLIAICLGAPAAAGEADEANLDVLVSTIEANKKALVAVNLGLEDAQAKAFWPVYDRYESELSGVNGRFAAIVAEYTKSFRSMSDEKARQLVKDYLAVERERADLREKYLDAFSEALPGRTLVRFYQIENKIQAIVRFQLARDIPVIDR